MRSSGESSIAWDCKNILKVIPQKKTVLNDFL